MDKIKINNIIVDNSNIKDIIKDYLDLKISIKDSDSKLKELCKFVGKDIFDEYKYLKDSKSANLNSFMLDNPLLSEFIDENNYNIYLKDKLEQLLEKKVDLSKLSNGINCQHEFIKLNNEFLCIKCFIKEDEFDYQEEDLISFLVDVAKVQGMYIDEIDDSELGLLEKVKMDHKNLIDKLKKQRNSLSKLEQENIDNTIIDLENNRTIEYRKALRKLRVNKLSIDE